MVNLELAGRRVAPLLVASLFAVGCNRDLTAPKSAGADAALQTAPTEPPGQAGKTTLAFRGDVASVDMNSQSLTLIDGTMIQFTAATRLPPGSDVQSLSELSVLVAQPQSTIFAHGVGQIVSQQPLVIAASQVTFQQR
jgi:hypothetical protein